MFNDLKTGSESILFVDDEDMILDIGNRMIEKLGYEVFTAKKGKEALEVFRAKKDEIDMVILDMVLPDIGGKEAYQELKNIDPDIKVLLSTGHSVEGQASEILKCGCNGFIQKPFNIKQLSVKIREVLDDAQLTIPPDQYNLSA